MQKREARSGYLFASPWLIGFSAFLAFPIIASLYYSFTNYSILRSPKWVGVSNYRELLGDEVFHQALKNTMLFLVAAVPLSTIAAISLAMLLNARVRGQTIYRTILFLPSLAPFVVLGTLFLWVFNGDYGLLNQGLKAAHLGTPDWLGDPAWAKWTLIIIAVWICGQPMVIYLAGLQNVPAALYEAAELDGAKFWAKTRCITLPMLSPVILFNVIMSMIAAIQVFAIPYVMFPNGAPARSTYFFTSYLFDTAFNYQRMGYASAMGWVMFVITLVLTLMALRVSEKHVHYEPA